MAASCCCESGVATKSIGRRCAPSISRKHCVANAAKTRAKPHLPWGSGIDEMVLVHPGSAPRATATPASHINAVSAGCGFQKKLSPRSIDETQIASTASAMPANCVSHVTYVTSKRRKVSTALQHGNPATRTEGFARHAQAPRKQKAIGPAQHVTGQCRSTALRCGAVAGIPVKMEPRSATNAIAHMR